MAITEEPLVTQTAERTTMKLNMGPQHPSTHGVLRVVLTLDGERVLKAEPVIGYLHRCHEKIYEHLTYPQIVPMVDRFDYAAALSNELVYVLAVEKLVEIEVPERAQYLRVLFAEFQRLLSHQLYFGSLALDTAGYTPFIYAFREREGAYDLLDKVTGQRLLYNYFRIGGLRNDVPDTWFKEFEDYIDRFEKEHWPEYMNLYIHNEIYRKRSIGVGVVTREQALEMNLTGQLLRAAGVNYDVRKAFPYSGYEKFDFEVPVTENGDAYDRTLVRMYEMLESIKIMRQVLRVLPDGPVMGKVPRAIRPSKGAEVYQTVESPRGEVGCHIVSDGSDKPYRLKWRSAAAMNLQFLDAFCASGTVADVVINLATLDPVMGEVDK